CGAAYGSTGHVVLPGRNSRISVWPVAVGNTTPARLYPDESGAEYGHPIGHLQQGKRCVAAAAGAGHCILPAETGQACLAMACVVSLVALVGRRRAAGPLYRLFG